MENQTDTQEEAAPEADTDTAEAVQEGKQEEHFPETYWAGLLQKGLIARFNRESRRAEGRLNICWSNLSGLDLRGANLKRAYLFGSDLSGCDLRGVDFSDAILEEANLEGADLRGTKGLTEEKLAGVFGLETSKRLAA